MNPPAISRSCLVLWLTVIAGLSGCVNPTWRDFPAVSLPRPFLPLAVKSPLAVKAAGEPCIDCEPPEFQFPSQVRLPEETEELPAAVFDGAVRASENALRPNDGNGELGTLIRRASLQRPDAPPDVPQDPGVYPRPVTPDDVLPDDDSPDFAAPDTEAAEIERLPMPPSEEVAADDLPELSFNEAVAATLQNDPVLRAGFQEIAMAGAELVTASLRPNPELEIIQSLLPFFRPFEADVREGGPPQFDVMVGYPIDWYLFGKRVAAMRSAAAEVRVSRAEYADLVRQRVLEVSEAYYDVMEAQAMVDLATQDSQNLLQAEEVTRIAVENGALPAVELSRIRLDRLNSQQVLRETLRDLRIAKAELRAVMGGMVPVAPQPNDDFRVSDDLAAGIDAPTRPMIAPEVDEAYWIAVTGRPDIQAMNLRIAQGRAEVESQQREAYPEVTPMLGYTHQFQRRAIGQPDAASWGAGVAMSLPIYDRNQGNRLLASTQWRQANLELQAGLVELRAEVVSVIAELETARVNAEAIADEQLRLAAEVRDAIRQAYEAGGRPLIDVLDSQRNFRETYGNYISSRADYLRAVQRFNAALGTQVIP